MIDRFETTADRSSRLQMFFKAGNPKNLAISQENTYFGVSL